MSLRTDKYIYDCLREDEDVIQATEGRIYNTGRDEIDEEEDKVPYVIISNDGTTSESMSADDFGESDVDNDTVSVLIVAATRSALADLAEAVRFSLRASLRNGDGEATDEMGYDITDYTFSAGSVNYDWSKPCYYQTLTYVIETTIKNE